jgi:hypothetical protein
VGAFGGTGRNGDSADVQALTRVKAEQASIWGNEGADPPE